MIVWNFSARHISFVNFRFRLIISKNLFSVLEMILDWWKIFAWISSSWNLEWRCAFHRHCCKTDLDAFNLMIFNLSNAPKYKDSRRSRQSFLFQFQRLSRFSQNCLNYDYKAQRDLKDIKCSTLIMACNWWIQKRSFWDALDFIFRLKSLKHPFFEFGSKSEPGHEI